MSTTEDKVASVMEKVDEDISPPMELFEAVDYVELLLTDLEGRLAGLKSDLERANR